MNITIKIEQPIPFWAPFRTLDEYLEWHRANDEWEKVKREQGQLQKWDWIIQNQNTF